MFSFLCIVKQKKKNKKESERSNIIYGQNSAILVMVYISAGKLPGLMFFYFFQEKMPCCFSKLAQYLHQKSDGTIMVLNNFLVNQGNCWVLHYRQTFVEGTKPKIQYNLWTKLGISGRNIYLLYFFCRRKCHALLQNWFSTYFKSQITPSENAQRWMGKNIFPILLLNDDNMIGEH